MTRLGRRAGAAVAAVFAIAAASMPSVAGEPKCPVGALDKADGPVEITFWYVQQGKNEEILLDLLDQFEASQDRVRVDAINQVAYPDSFDKYKAGLGSGDLPDLVQMEETTVQSLVDSQSTIPIGACVKADDYDTSDFLTNAIDYYTTEGTLRSMPWTVSNPVLIYDKNDFRAAGLDPEDPPDTFDEITEYGEQIQAAGAAQYGMSVWAEPYINEYFFAKSGLLYVNHENGREERATESVLDSKGGRRIWSWWDDLVDSGVGVYTGSQPGSIDHLLAIGTGNAAMTVEASAALGPIFDVLSQGEFADVDVGVGPLPSLEGGGGVPVGDASLWIPDTGSKEKEAAAWELVKFLSDPAQIAAFTVGTKDGFIPIRTSAATDPAVQELWAQNPALKVPYDQLEAGSSNPAAVGSVIGDYKGVRDAVRDALTAMFTQGLSPQKALARAERDASQAIQEYNERVGA